MNRMVDHHPTGDPGFTGQAKGRKLRRKDILSARENPSETQ